MFLFYQYERRQTLVLTSAWEDLTVLNCTYGVSDVGYIITIIVHHKTPYFQIIQRFGVILKSNYLLCKQVLEEATSI